MMRLLGPSIVALLLPACIPMPHTSEKFPAMHGRVVDATTHQPVVGASIAVHAHPSTTTTSDQLGCFHFRRYANFHIGYGLGICPTDCPPGSHWDTVLDIRHPDYQPRTADVQYDRDAPCDPSDWPLKDILLVPKNR